MSDVYLTPHQQVRVSPFGWRRLPSGIWVTTTSLADLDRPGLFAHLDYDSLEKVAARIGARLLAPTTVVELNRHGLRLKPEITPGDAMMSSRARCDGHDMAVWRQVVAAEWDGSLPWSGSGKPWVIEAPPGRSRLFGWPKRADSSKLGPQDFDHWYQPLQVAHNRRHVDYSSTQTLEADENLGVEPWGPPRVSSQVPANAPVAAKSEKESASMQEIKFVQARNFTKGRKDPKTGKPCGIDLLVIHDMESAESTKTAENVAAWFAGPNAPRASAHYNVDSDSIVQSVRDEDTAWHAPGANHNGIGIEHAGYAKQTAAEWADEFSAAMLERSSTLMASLCDKHGVPVVFVSAAGLLRGERGITTHAEVSKAFKKSTHVDPGKNFPLTSFIEAIASKVKDMTT